MKVSPGHQNQPAISVRDQLHYIADAARQQDSVADATAVVGISRIHLSFVVLGMDNTLITYSRTENVHEYHREPEK